MVRIVNLCSVLALIVAAIYAYSIKYQTIFNAERIVKLRHEIKAEEDQIGIARAEWAHLIRPERIEALSNRLLDLQPLALNQIVKAEAIPAKAQRFDVIGHKLEALGLSEPTNTPLDSANKGAATPSSVH